MNTRCIVAVLGLAVTVLVRADGPADNRPRKVRPIPPPGITVPAAEQRRLEAGALELERLIAALQIQLGDRPALCALVPDVQIYHNAVRYALTYHEFYRRAEFRVAQQLLQQGLQRANDLLAGKSPWTTQTGLVVRGYVSRIDGSVQPYGLVVPASYRPPTAHRFRLDVWCHGRGETLTELNFMRDRQQSVGEFAPANTFVLHPYGRYCNANKFAGEVDLFEALAHVRRNYPIDENRLVMRGFSMGGAACWQFAVHYAGQWAAAAPGAGFSETADFLKVFQKEKVQPTWYEKKLWHLYDCTDYAVNLFNCPVVAYSGEVDSQKQAADMMAKAMAAEGMTLVHLIGPRTGHGYHPQVKEELSRRIDSIAERGRDPLPKRVRFTTWTLRYHRMRWVKLDGLGKHWERARVDAAIVDRQNVKVTTQNVTALTLSMAPGACPLDNTRRPTIDIDGTRLRGTTVLSDRSWTTHLVRPDVRAAWQGQDTAGLRGLHKRPGLQGPIDDAFMDRFVMVRPTGKPVNDKVGAWAKAEMQHALEHWRRQFRGEARVVNDDALTDTDLADSNLILWGDRASNKLLGKMVARLPIHWDAKEIRVGSKTYPADHHVPVMIYPNPLNPRRYVVLNSGFTFREYDYLNNARQVPKLPDFAVVDISVGPNSRWPGRIAAAGFFDEQWQLAAQQ